MSDDDAIKGLGEKMRRATERVSGANSAGDIHLCESCVYGHIRVEVSWGSTDRIIMTNCRALGEGALDDVPEDEALEAHEEEIKGPRATPLGPGYPIMGRVAECSDYAEVEADEKETKRDAAR